MKLIDVFAKLNDLKHNVIKTQDVAAYFNISLTHASKLLSRLAEANQLIHIGRGLWAFPGTNPLELVEYLAAPFPAYLSLQTALYYHGMISQIPDTIYAVTIGRTHLFKMPTATLSTHHVSPDFFFGYEVSNDSIKIATPEKALIDILYFKLAKSKLFASLPEIEFPKNFKIKTAQTIIKKIPSKSRRTFVEKSFRELLNLHKSATD